MCVQTHQDSEKGSFGLPFSLSAFIPFRFFYLLIYHYYERYGICMENNYLIVVVMQKDFVTGSLGSPEAVAIVPAVVQKTSSFPGTVLFTKDTHGADYSETQEGQNLPVPHCIKGTDGWELIPELASFAVSKEETPVFEKGSFGSPELALWLLAAHKQNPISSITLIGVCTDICVVSNALLIKAFLPEVPIHVDASCCAGVTKEKHEAALETMRSCQIDII